MGTNLRMLRDAEGTLESWIAGGTQMGRRSKERRRNGDGTETGRRRDGDGTVTAQKR